MLIRLALWSLACGLWCSSVFVREWGVNGPKFGPKVQTKRVDVQSRAAYRDGKKAVRKDPHGWDICWNSGFRGPLSKLSASDLQQFKEEHFREVEVLRRRDGIGRHPLCGTTFVSKGQVNK